MISIPNDRKVLKSLAHRFGKSGKGCQVDGRKYENWRKVSKFSPLERRVYSIPIAFNLFARGERCLGSVTANAQSRDPIRPYGRFPQRLAFSQGDGQTRRERIAGAAGINRLNRASGDQFRSAIVHEKSTPVAQRDYDRLGAFSP